MPYFALNHIKKAFLFKITINCALFSAFSCIKWYHNLRYHFHTLVFTNINCLFGR